MIKKHLLMWFCYLPVLLAAMSSSAWAALDEWTFIGPLGGRIQAIAVNQSVCDSIYAVANWNLYVTGDQGDHWEHIATAPTDLNRIYIDPERTGTLYAIAVYRLYKSTDAGASWTELTAYVYSFAFDPQNSTYIYTGSRDGVLRKSNNRGSTWADLETGSPWDIRSIAVSCTDANTVFAGASGDWDFPGDGVFKTTDGGLNWFPADSLLPSTNIFSLIIDPLQSETIYAGTAGSGQYFSFGAWRSTDGGVSWEEINSGLSPNAVLSCMRAVPGQSGHLYIGWGSGLYTSDDAGTSWSEVDLGWDAGGAGSIEFCLQEPDALFIGNGNGLLKMTSWYDRAAIIGVAPVDIDAVAIDPYDPDIIYAGGLTIYKSENGGSSWKIFNFGLEKLVQGMQGYRHRPGKHRCHLYG